MSLGVDLAVLSLLGWAAWRAGGVPSGGVPLAWLRRGRWVAVPIAVLAAMLAWQQVRVANAAGGKVPEFFGENLVGQPVPRPLLRAAGLAGDRRETLFVLLRPDCEHCRELASRWQAPIGGDGRAVRCVGVSIGSEGWTVAAGRVAAEFAAGVGTVVRWDDREPFVAAPTIIETRDGRITAVHAGSAAEVWPQRTIATGEGA